MAGDRAAVEAGHYLDLTAAPKVFVKGPMVIGYTSSFRMGEALKHRLVVPNPPRDGMNEAMELAELDRWMAVEFTDSVRNLMRDIGYMKVSEGRESGGIFLVGIFGRIYTFDEDFCPRPALKNYAACGSGMSVIQGALHATSDLGLSPCDRLLRSLEAASDFVATVHGPFDVVELK